MSTPKDGGPAFPQPNHIVEHDTHGRVEARQWMQDSGMSLRDWFAGQAIAGRLIDHDVKTALVGVYAYQIADSMLAEREKGPQ